LGNLREGIYFEELGFDKRIILKLIFRENDGRAWDWIDLPRHRDRWLL